MKKRSKSSRLAWGFLAIILIFLGYRGYCTFIRERNVFDQMYYSRAHKSTELDWFIDYRRLFADMPQIRIPPRGSEDASLWLGNSVFESYDDNYLEDGHEISFTFFVDDPVMYITYSIDTKDDREWYSYCYDVDKKTLTYKGLHPENTEMKNFLFDRVLPDWFAANQERTRFSIENLGEYTLIDPMLEVQYENYSIGVKQISFRDVQIRYPVFVLDGSPFEESINTLLSEMLICTPEDQEMLKNYKGEQYWNNSYDITFANEDIVSILVHTDGMQGGGRGAENWNGVTWSISEQRLLRLSDLCTWEDLVQCVGTPEDLLKRVPEEKIGQYVADELPSEIDWEGEDHFYLGPDFVGLILWNRESSKLENWAFEVPFDWTKKEY